MKNHFDRQSLFLLGNGPSLNNYDLELLADRHTMCFNRFYLKDAPWYPTFYLVADESIIQDYGAEIRRYIKHIEYPYFPHTHPSGYEFVDSVSDSNITWFGLKWGGFSLNGKLTFGLNHTVASVGMQLAYWLGFKTIYLLGVDMDFKLPEDVIKVDERNYISGGLDPNHFDVNYFGAGHRFHLPDNDEMIRLFGKLSKRLQDKGVRIVNLNPDSKFRECEFGEYERALEYETKN